MAINNHTAYHERGSIQSITNVEGQWYDAEDANAKLAHDSHSAVDTVNPWSQSFRPSSEIDQLLQPEPIEVDPQLIAANMADLKIRNIK